MREGSERWAIIEVAQSLIGDKDCPKLTVCVQLIHYSTARYALSLGIRAAGVLCPSLLALLFACSLVPSCQTAAKGGWGPTFVASPVRAKTVYLMQAEFGADTA